MTVSSIKDAAKAAKIRAYRKAFIKRRNAITGLFESSWQEITSDIKKWGNIRMSADYERVGKYTLDGIRLAIHNDTGRYNPNTDPNSLWFGYMDQQRTLVKIEAGFVHETLGSDLIWSRRVFPNAGIWDSDEWDEGSWDSTPTVFTGIISGEVFLSDANEVTIQAKPLTQIFRDFPAASVSGLDNSITASRFMTLLRDQTDGSGSYVFRPFFGDTTTNWDISATSNVFSALNTTTAKDIRDKTCWDVMEKLAEAENFSIYVDQAGIFHFIPKTAAATVSFEFHGIGSFDSEYGHTIKSIDRFGFDYAKYYSRVQVRFGEADTSTSFVAVASSFQVGGANGPWSYGHRTFNIENYWIPNTTSATDIATSVFNELSSLKKTVDFKTSFVPHLNLLNRVSLHYDSTSRAQANTLWDVNDWDTELEWDSSQGDAIVLEGEEFKFLTIEINLDSLECKYIAREI